MTLTNTSSEFPDLYSVECDSFYVGVTKNMTRRTKEHSICGAIDAPIAYQRLYSHIAKIGFGSYQLIPIHDVRTNALEEETKFIKHLNRQLNTNKVSRKRKCNSSSPVMAVICMEKYERNQLIPFKKRKIGVREYVVHKSGCFEPVKSPLLHTMLRHIEEHCTVNIFWSSNNTHDFAHWRGIKRIFGKSVVVLPTRLKGNFEDEIPKIRDESHVSLTIRLKRTAESPTKELLLDFVKKTGIWIRKLHSLPFHSLLQLHAEAQRTKCSFQNKAIFHIQTALKARYGSVGIPKITMKIPVTHSAPTKKIKQAFRVVVSSLPLSEEIQSKVVESFRVVNTARPSVAKILHNHISFAKNFDKNKPPACICGDDTTNNVG